MPLFSVGLPLSILCWSWISFIPSAAVQLDKERDAGLDEPPCDPGTSDAHRGATNLMRKEGPGTKPCRQAGAQVEPQVLGEVQDGEHKVDLAASDAEAKPSKKKKKKKSYTDKKANAKKRRCEKTQKREWDDDEGVCKCKVGYKQKFKEDGYDSLMLIENDPFTCVLECPENTVETMTAASDEAVGCQCKDDMIGEVQAVEGGWVPHCHCPTNSHLVEGGCKCDLGYSITDSHNDHEELISCAPVKCPEHSERTTDSPADCECTEGYNGTIVAKENETEGGTFYEGTCDKLLAWTWSREKDDIERVDGNGYETPPVSATHADFGAGGAAGENDGVVHRIGEVTCGTAHCPDGFVKKDNAEDLLCQACDATTCCDKLHANCTSFDCPAGYERRETENVCRGEVCEDSDRDTCCQKKKKAKCFDVRCGTGQEVIPDEVCRSDVCTDEDKEQCCKKAVDVSAQKEEPTEFSNTADATVTLHGKNEHDEKKTDEAAEINNETQALAQPAVTPAATPAATLAATLDATPAGTLHAPGATSPPWNPGI